MIICDEAQLWCLAEMAIVAVVVILMVVVIVVLLWWSFLRPIIVVLLLLIMVLVVASTCCNSPWWWFSNFALRFATERGQGVIFSRFLFMWTRRRLGVRRK